MSNHLKWLANELPVTFIYAGVGLGERRFFEEGLTGAQAAFAQSGRRWTRLAVDLFDRDEHWRALVKAIDRQVVLSRHRPGQLGRQADYLFTRTGGHIGSLMTLVNRACFKAIRSGAEALNRELLDSVRIDETAEKASRRTQSAKTKAVTA